jgi:hypothetical protein
LKNKDSAFDNIYPLFRKRTDGKTFYKIFSDLEFEELKILGKKYTIQRIKAAQYPEKLYIMELIETSNTIEKLDDQEYSEILNFCQSKLTNLI